MPKQITLEEILSKYHKLMNKLPVNDYRVWHIDLVTNDKRHTFRGSVIEDFLTTYFTQFAESLRLEAEHEDYNEETHTKDSGLRTALTFNRGLNQAKTNLDEKINKALGKEPNS